MNSKQHDFFLLLTCIPILILFALSAYDLMELYLKITFTLVFLYYLVFKNSLLTLSYLFVTIPLHALMKGGYFFYNVIPVILFISLIRSLKSNAISTIFKNTTFKFFLFGSIFYYLISLLVSGGSISSNLKVLEFAFCLFVIPTLYQNKYLFKRSLFYFGLLSISLSLIFSTTSSRTNLVFEYADIASISGLNPLIFGIPLIVFLILYFNENFILKINKGFVNKEKWLFILAVFAIFLTTSRTSILAIFTCFLFYYFKKNLLLILQPIVIITIVFIIFHSFLYTTLSGYAEAYDFIVGRSLDENIDFNQYSHDRADMYSLIFNEIQKGNYIFNGILPGGDTTEIYKRISNTTHMIHSLSLKLIIEIGLFFTTIIFLSLISYVIKSLRRDNFYQYTGIIGWLMICFFTTGLDVLSGLVLSISFIQVNNGYEK